MSEILCYDVPVLTDGSVLWLCMIIVCLVALVTNKLIKIMYT